MPYLLDTNILVRLANVGDLLHPDSSRAVHELHRRSEVLHITAQNLIEFRATATRPIAVNGLGLSGAAADIQAAGFQAAFALLPETAAILPAWQRMVTTLGVTGKPVHDARLVAVCHVHGVDRLLTFNTRDFARYAGYGPGLLIVDPRTV